MQEVNYKIIRELQKSERESTSLTKLDEEFQEMVQAYLYDLSERVKKTSQEDTIFSEELKEQLEMEYSNAKKLVAEIYEIRERKVMLRALTNIRTNTQAKTSDNMLSFESELYESVKKVLEEQRNKFLVKTLTPSKRITEQKVLKTKKVRILEEIPSFVWEDEQTYGPFKEGSAASLPESVAEFLVDNNKAVQNEASEESEEILSNVQETHGTQGSESKGEEQERSRQD